MTHKICISLDEEAWKILQAIIENYKKGDGKPWMKAQCNPSAVIRAGLEALAVDVFCMVKIDKVIGRKWSDRASTMF